MNANFKPRVALKKGEKCSWKKHFRGCARDLIGYMESVVRKNPDRVVFAKVSRLVKGCNGAYRDNKKPYSESAVKIALRLFREHKIVSGRFEERVDGVGGKTVREPFVLAPHDCMCIHHGRECEFVGQGRGQSSATWVNEVWVRDPVSSEAAGLTIETGPHLNRHSNRDCNPDSSLDSNPHSNPRIENLSPEPIESTAGSAVDGTPSLGILGSPHTHTPTHPPEPETRGVCVDRNTRDHGRENTTAQINETILVAAASLPPSRSHTTPEGCVDALIRGFTKRNGSPARRITRRKEMLALAAKYGCSRFHTAGNAWLKEQPWDNNTDCPFNAFADGFAGYDAMAVVAADEKQRRIKQEQELKESLEVLKYKQPVEHIPEEFISTLPPKAQDYIAAVLKATKLAEMPAGGPELSFELAAKYREFWHEKERQEPGPQALFDEPMPSQKKQ